MTEDNFNDDDICIDKIADELKKLSHGELWKRALISEVLLLVVLKKIIPEERDAAQKLLEETKLKEKGKAKKLLEETTLKAVLTSLLEGVKLQKTFHGKNDLARVSQTGS